MILQENPKRSPYSHFFPMVSLIPNEIFFFLVDQFVFTFDWITKIHKEILLLFLFLHGDTPILVFAIYSTSFLCHYFSILFNPFLKEFNTRHDLFIIKLPFFKKKSYAKPWVIFIHNEKGVQAYVIFV